MNQSITFSLDLEDHRADRSGKRRYPDITRRIIEFLDSHEVKGTFFVVGHIVDEEPGLIQEIADKGHELAFHSYYHRPLTDEQRDRFVRESREGIARLEDASGKKIFGFRAPSFSLTSSSLWVVDALKEIGFSYSSSVLPASNPMYGFSDAPNTPYYWPNGLLEIPVPVARFGLWQIPYLGGVYLRYLPLLMIDSYRRSALPAQTLWTYCHPYDFDVDEPYTAIHDAPLWVSLILWFRRKHTYTKLAKLLDGNTAPPFIEQISAGQFKDAPVYTPSSQVQH